jgi:hypothetical protein
MVYLNPEALSRMHDDVAAWFRESVASAASGRPPARPSARPQPQAETAQPPSD